MSQTDDSLPVRVGESTMATRRWPGEGPPLVLLHGLAISGAYFWPLAEALSPEWTCWVPELPGTGRSGPMPAAPEVETLARWLREWMDEVGLPEAVFVANSFGCQIVAELACAHPERVGAAVWLGPAIDGRDGIVRQGLRLARCAFREPLALVRRFVVDVLRHGPLRAVATFFRASRHPFRERVRAITAPVLIVRGDRDPLTTEPFARELAALLPRGRYRELPGAHAVHFEDPGALAAALRPYLREVTGS